MNKFKFKLFSTLLFVFAIFASDFCIAQLKPSNLTQYTEQDVNMYSPINKSFRPYNFADLIDRSSNIEVNIGNICQDDKGRICFGIATYYG